MKIFRKMFGTLVIHDKIFSQRRILEFNIRYNFRTTKKIDSDDAKVKTVK